MASYGSGFAQGMGAGSNLVSNAYGVYRGKKLFDQQESDRASREGAIGSLFDENNHSAQQGQDVAQYEQERANLLDGGYQPNEAETQALDQGQQNLEETAPSTLFFNKVTGMSSQERLGHMVELFQGNGGKVNEASLGALKGVNSLFDNAKTQDQQFAASKAQEEQRMAMAKAYEAQARKYEAEANNPNAGRGAPNSVREFERMKMDPDYKAWMEKKTNKSSTADRRTKLQKLIDERKNFAPDSEEYQIFSDSIELTSKGKPDPFASFLAKTYGIEEDSQEEGKDKKQKFDNVDDILKGL